MKLLRLTTDIDNHGGGLFEIINWLLMVAGRGCGLLGIGCCEFFEIMEDRGDEFFEIVDNFLC